MHATTAQPTRGIISPAERLKVFTNGLDGNAARWFDLGPTQALLMRRGGGFELIQTRTTLNKGIVNGKFNFDPDGSYAGSVSRQRLSPRVLEALSPKLVEAASSFQHTEADADNLIRSIARDIGESIDLSQRRRW